MRVKMMPADFGACGFYRMRAVAEALKNSTDIVISVVDKDSDAGALEVHFRGGPTNPTPVRVEDPQCDVVVMQRPMNRLLVETIPLLQQQHNVAVVVEIDDDLDTISPDNAAFAAISPLKNQMSNSAWFKLACQRADLVTCSTKALETRYAKHGRMRLLPNCVPSAYLNLKQEKQREQVTVGWTGNANVHPRDLEVVEDAASKALGANDAFFHAIGDAKTLDRLAVHGAYSKWLPLDAYLQEVANLDVGIAPLEKTAFNRAKSWLKPLEYAALGVACVSSDLPEYRLLHQQGVGLLADTRDEWFTHLSALSAKENSNLRDEIAARGREAAQKWTYEIKAEKWLQAWADARSMRGSFR
jgi:hypothetical protein